MLKLLSACLVFLICACGSVSETTPNSDRVSTRLQKDFWDMVLANNVVCGAEFQKTFASGPGGERGVFLSNIPEPSTSRLLMEFDDTTSFFYFRPGTLEIVLLGVLRTGKTVNQVIYCYTTLWP